MTTRAIEASHPLSPMQQGLLVGARMGADAAANLEQLVLRLPEAVDPGALRASWESVVRRHASLRSTVRWEGGGEPVMVVHDDAPPQWEEHDWRALSPATVEGALRRFLRDDRARGVDVRRAPTMRLTLLRLGEADFR
ncbi:MAG TPA: condensation domain-containing protein, partial [Longimicrobium sp.]|nr:condensation domain-containing protein [Longimicrobium sp.]